MSNEPLVKGGQGRDAKDVTGDAALLFTYLGLLLLLISFCLSTG